ncbi:MAG: polyprenyl synthetase family protein, partial [Desulfobulbaceae bacterium]|nr:polyprenyl synthetase family protein [Desulfobulbaceae bacterium]
MDKDKLLDLLKPDRETIDATMRSELSSIDNSLLSEVIQHGIFNGGKRIRPMLTVLAARLCSPDAFSAANDSGQKVTQLFLLAIIFEYLHGASLLHDDVIDRADTRRGKPSANALWGTTPVILAGDYLHTRAMVLAGTAGNTRCLQTIGHATAAMIEAEFLQMQNADHHNLSEKDYFDVLNGKTAALIAAACKVGAIAAEGTEDQCQALESYGANLGVAFQVVDDLL